MTTGWQNPAPIADQPGEAAFRVHDAGQERRHDHPGSWRNPQIG
jgi:hypothetical protein